MHDEYCNCCTPPDWEKNRFQPENRFIGDIEDGKRYPFGVYTKEESDERFASKATEEAIGEIDDIKAEITELDNNKADKDDLEVLSFYATPQMYGAKGDGVTDDSAAFDRLFAENNTITIPEGEYLVDYAFYELDGKTIHGESRDKCVIIQKNFGTPFAIIGKNTVIDGLTFKMENDIENNECLVLGFKGDDWHVFFGSRITNIHIMGSPYLTGIFYDLRGRGSWGSYIDNVIIDVCRIGIEQYYKATTTSRGWQTYNNMANIIITTPYEIGFYINFDEEAQAQNIQFSQSRYENITVQMTNESADRSAVAFKLEKGDYVLDNPTVFSDNAMGTTYCVDFGVSNKNLFYVPTIQNGCLEGLIKNREYMELWNIKNTSFIERANSQATTKRYFYSSPRIHNVGDTIFEDCLNDLSKLNYRQYANVEQGEDDYGKYIEMIPSQYSSVVQSRVGFTINKQKLANNNYPKISIMAIFKVENNEGQSSISAQNFVCKTTGGASDIIPAKTYRIDGTLFGAVSFLDTTNLSGAETVTAYFNFNTWWSTNQDTTIKLYAFVVCYDLCQFDGFADFHRFLHKRSINSELSEYNLIAINRTTSGDNSATLNILDCNNLNTYESNGVTFTPEYDDNGLLKSIEINGTATAAATYRIYSNQNKIYPALEKGTTYTGYISDVSTNGLFFQYFDFVNLSWVEHSSTSQFNFTVDQISTGSMIQILVTNGTTINNKRVYPMIVKKSDIKTALQYTPYVPSISRLNYKSNVNVSNLNNISDSIAIGENSGSINLINALDFTTSESNGITATPVFDTNGLLKYIELNGTATGGNSTHILYRNESKIIGDLQPKDKCILYGRESQKNGLFLQYFDFVNNAWREVSSTTKTEFTVKDGSTGSLVQIFISNGTTVTNEKIYPMICKSSYFTFEEPTYKPFSMSNAQLYSEIKSLRALIDGLQENNNE